MQLSNLLRPEKVKNYQETVLKESVFRYYDNALKAQIYDLGRTKGLTLPLSEAGIDGYYSGEELLRKALESGIDLKYIATDVFEQLIKMGWSSATAHAGEDQMTINLEA